MAGVDNATPPVSAATRLRHTRPQHASYTAVRKMVICAFVMAQTSVNECPNLWIHLASRCAATSRPPATKWSMAQTHQALAPPAPARPDREGLPLELWAI